MSVESLLVVGLRSDLFHQPGQMYDAIRRDVNVPFPGFLVVNLAQKASIVCCDVIFLFATFSSRETSSPAASLWD